MGRQRLKWLLGQMIKVSAIVVGIYLIVITFGYEPLKKMAEIANQEQGLSLLGKILLQLLKIMFGMGYSFIGMGMLYRFGIHLINKSKKQ